MDSLIDRLAIRYRWVARAERRWYFARRTVSYHIRVAVMRLTAREGVEFWNDDKPHRCPECHTVVDPGRPRGWLDLYQCCRCGTLFARWPRFAWRLRTCKDISLGTCPHQKLP